MQCRYLTAQRCRTIRHISKSEFGFTESGSFHRREVTDFDNFLHQEKFGSRNQRHHGFFLVVNDGLADDSHGCKLPSLEEFTAGAQRLRRDAEIGNMKN
jgi:hypothetical protein